MREGRGKGKGKGKRGFTGGKQQAKQGGAQLRMETQNQPRVRYRDPTIRRDGGEVRWRRKKPPHVVDPTSSVAPPIVNAGSLPALTESTSLLGSLANVRNVPTSMDFGTIVTHGGPGNNATVRAMLGFDYDGDPRWPTPFSMASSGIVTDSYLVSPATSFVTSTTGLSWGGGCAGWHVGQVGKASIGINPSYTASSTSVAVTWATASNPERPEAKDEPTCTFADVGLVTRGYGTRPIASISRISVEQVGSPHEVRLFAVPLPAPRSYMYGVSVNTTGGNLPEIYSLLPAHLETGLNRAQIMMGGRTFIMGEKPVTLCSGPVDSTGLVFEPTCSSAGDSMERCSPSDIDNYAWQGWVWWIWGLSSWDKVNLFCTALEEYVPESNSTAIAQSAPLTYRMADSSYTEKTANTVERLFSEGWAAYAPSVYEAVGKVAKGGLMSLLNDIPRDHFGLVENCNPTGYRVLCHTRPFSPATKTSRLSSSSMPSAPREEKEDKEYVFTPPLPGPTPVARRPKA